MDDSFDSALSCSFSSLAGSIQELDSLLREVRVTSEDILFQLAAVDFAWQVLEAAKATLLLQLTAIPRTNWVTARLAFESMHDLFYLLELCPDRQTAGAKVYVGAMAARKEAHGKLQGVAATDERGAESEVQPGLRDFVRVQATEIEGIDPGAEDAIVQALEERLKGGDHHWSGLPRRQMTKRIRDKLDNPELTRMFDAYYYTLSVNAHPRLRIGDALRIEPGRIRIVPDPPDDAACAIAFAAVQTVLQLLKEHVVSGIGR